MDGWPAVPDRVGDKFANQHLDGERDVDAIIDVLAGRFEAPRDVIAADILPMLQNLVDEKVLRG